MWSKGGGIHGAVDTLCLGRGPLKGKGQSKPIRVGKGGIASKTQQSGWSFGSPAERWGEWKVTQRLPEKRDVKRPPRCPKWVAHTPAVHTSPTAAKTPTVAFIISTQI